MYFLNTSCRYTINLWKNHVIRNHSYFLFLLPNGKQLACPAYCPVSRSRIGTSFSLSQVRDALTRLMFKCVQHWNMSVL